MQKHTCTTVDINESILALMRYVVQLLHKAQLNMREKHMEFLEITFKWLASFLSL